MVEYFTQLLVKEFKVFFYVIVDWLKLINIFEDPECLLALENIKISITLEFFVQVQMTQLTLFENYDLLLLAWRILRVNHVVLSEHLDPWRVFAQLHEHSLKNQIQVIHLYPILEHLRDIVKYIAHIVDRVNEVQLSNFFNRLKSYDHLESYPEKLNKVNNENDYSEDFCPL